MSKIIASLVLVAVLALPGVATAQTPGGNSGVDEYTETTPGAGGNQPTGGDDGSSGGGPLTPAQVTALEEQGADGAAAAALAESTGPDRNGEGGSGGDSQQGTGTADDGSGVAEVIGDLAGGDDSGMGIALPLILAAAVVGAVAFVIVRRSGSGHTDPA